MTKVTILGQEPKGKELKKIEAIACIQAGLNGGLYYDNNYTLSSNNQLRIIKLNNNSYHFDCLIITDDDAVLIGHFNDGIV